MRNRCRLQHSIGCLLVNVRYDAGHPPVAVAVLCLRNRLRSAKGAQEQSGANVRTKTGLNRSLSRAG